MTYSGEAIDTDGDFGEPSWARRMGRQAGKSMLFVERLRDGNFEFEVRFDLEKHSRCYELLARDFEDAKRKSDELKLVPDRVAFYSIVRLVPAGSPHRDMVVHFFRGKERETYGTW